MAVIAYLNEFSAPNALDIYAQHGQHELVRIDGTWPLDRCFDVLSRAHAYQCVGARNEVPKGLRVDAEFLKHTPDLLVVSASGSGVDVFDLPSCTQAGVVAVNQSGANAESVAEHALAMILSLQKRVQLADRKLRRGWSGSRSEFFGRDLKGRTLGIVGLGHIGERLAKICSLAFDCTVLAYDPFLDADVIRSRFASKVDLSELLARSDIVSIHTPLTPDTRLMFDRDTLLAMKAGSLLISTARGSIHDEQGLAECLMSGHIAGAGLDVWDFEPPPATHPLLALDNVIATPHVAGGTHDSLENMARYAATQIIDILAGEPVARPVNCDVLPRFQQRINQYLSSTHSTPED